MKKDRFAETKMRFVIENPPFGTPWGGKDAAEGVEKAVNDEYAKGLKAVGVLGSLVPAICRCCFCNLLLTKWMITLVVLLLLKMVVHYFQVVQLLAKAKFVVGC